MPSTRSHRERRRQYRHGGRQLGRTPTPRTSTPAAPTCRTGNQNTCKYSGTEPVTPDVRGHARHGRRGRARPAPRPPPGTASRTSPAGRTRPSPPAGSTPSPSTRPSGSAPSSERASTPPSGSTTRSPTRRCSATRSTPRARSSRASGTAARRGTARITSTATTPPQPPGHDTARGGTLECPPDGASGSPTSTSARLRRQLEQQPVAVRPHRTGHVDRPGRRLHGRGDRQLRQLQQQLVPDLRLQRRRELRRQDGLDDELDLVGRRLEVSARRSTCSSSRIRRARA